MSSFFTSSYHLSSPSRWGWERNKKEIVIDGEETSTSPVVNAVPIDDNEDEHQCTEIDFAEILEILCEDDLENVGAATAFPVAINVNTYADDNDSIITAIPLYQVDSFPYHEIAIDKDNEDASDTGLCWQVDGSRGGGYSFLDNEESSESAAWVDENSLQEIQNFLYLQDIENLEDWLSDGDYNRSLDHDYADYSLVENHPYLAETTHVQCTESSTSSIQQQRSSEDDASFRQLKRQRMNAASDKSLEHIALNEVGQDQLSHGHPNLITHYLDSPLQLGQVAEKPQRRARKLGSKAKKKENGLDLPVAALSRRQLATAQRTRDNGRFRRNQVEWVSVTDLFDS